MSSSCVEASIVSGVLNGVRYSIVTDEAVAALDSDGLDGFAFLVSSFFERRLLLLDATVGQLVSVLISSGKADVVVKSLSNELDIVLGNSSSHSHEGSKSNDLRT